jgi:ER lumen protein retaining receptor
MRSLFGARWNVFRYAADLSHLISVVLLLYRMWRKKSCSGISLKTQLLYVVVHVTRYCNASFFSPPVYNVLFKIFYLATAVAILWLMKRALAETYERRHDTFRIVFIIAVAALCAVPSAVSARRGGAGFFEAAGVYLWAFSLWTEALAVLPQIFLLVRSRRVDVLTLDSLFFMSIYRLFYLLNWVYQLISGVGPRTPVIYVTGVLQTAIYADYIFFYVRTKIGGENPGLPI